MLKVKEEEQKRVLGERDVLSEDIDSLQEQIKEFNRLNIKLGEQLKKSSLKSDRLELENAEFAVAL